MLIGIPLTLIGAVCGLYVLLTGATFYAIERRRTARQVSLVRSFWLALLSGVAGHGLAVLAAGALVRIAGGDWEIALLAAAATIVSGGGAVAGYLLFWLVLARQRQAAGAALRSLLAHLPIAAALGVAAVPGVFAVRLALQTFEVPTGGMAPTIRGIHSVVVCESCEYPFAVSQSARLDGMPGETTAVCPNCEQPQVLAADAPVRPGDRIAVERGRTPRRWEIVSFRSPDPQRAIFVQRLVALPGESVRIAGGDVWIDGRRLRKPPDALEELWLPVHDTAYARPRREEGRGWIAAPGAPPWEVSAEGLQVAAGAEAAALVFAHVLRDWLAYNPPPRPGWPDEFVPVRDVRVRLEVAHLSGDGALGVAWWAGGQEVHAEISPAGGVVLRAAPAGDGPADRAAEAAARGELTGRAAAPLEIIFAVRDGLAAVLEGGRVVVELDLDALAADAADHRANFPGAEPRLEENRLALSARDCRVHLARVRIDRDVHYLSAEELQAASWMAAGTAELTGGGEVALGADEHYVLGDNSRASRDSRLDGPLPAERLHGVVRWRYWPWERRARFAVP